MLTEKTITIHSRFPSVRYLEQKFCLRARKCIT